MPSRTISINSDVLKELKELQRQKYPATTTNTELISVMIKDLSKDLEPERRVLKLLNGYSE